MNYNHININERSCIYQFLSLGMSIRGIAKALHRSPSTISREIKRNSYRAWSNFKEHDRYFPVKAQEKYEERRTRCHRPARCQEQEIHYIKEKIEKISTRVYGAEGVDYMPKAVKEIEELEKLGYGKLPICMAKTQYSLTDDQTKLGRPENFRITIRQVTVSAGAGFIVALTGEIMKMPGLPKVPAAEKIDVDNNGKISGLF